MTAASLIITADRRSLRAYRVEETPTRGPNLGLEQALEVTDAINAASMRHPTPMADWPQLEVEMERQIHKNSPPRSRKSCERHQPEGWSFAAPASIHAVIVDLLPLKIRQRIVEHVKSDLVKIELVRLPENLRSLQPI